MCRYVQRPMRSKPIRKIRKHLKSEKKKRCTHGIWKTKQNRFTGPWTMILAWRWIIQRWICSCFISVGPSCQHWLDYCQSIVFRNSEPFEMFNREVVVFFFFVMYSACRLWRTCALHLATTSGQGVFLSRAYRHLAFFFFFFYFCKSPWFPQLLSSTVVTPS